MSLINKKSKKRGLSSIIGTLLMVAVVASIGSVILFQALNGINDFNYYLSFLTGSKNSLHENAVIEHVRFNPTTEDLVVWVRNTGTVQFEISKITVVNLDTQELVLPATNPHITVSIGQVEDISEPVDLDVLTPGFEIWDTAPYNGHQYKISLTTALGNSFETVASPFNS